MKIDLKDKRTKTVIAGLAALAALALGTNAEVKNGSFCVALPGNEPEPAASAAPEPAASNEAGK